MQKGWGEEEEFLEMFGRCSRARLGCRLNVESKEESGVENVVQIFGLGNRGGGGMVQ